MKRNLLILPFILLGAFVFFNYSCEEEKEDDLCEAFDISEIYAQCETPTSCCPPDGGNCYYVNPDGANYMCNGDDCETALDNYIDDHCAKKSISNEEIKVLKAKLSVFTKQLMEKARLQSVCM
ncbi:MAG: hypothetical protein PF489_14705 [Salinivirgaceae bacterium]|jgi:hypothetical protein|nr:hypothetical protein [Salinivirgaceae bacterium]